MPTSGGPGEPTPPVPGALSASRAEPRIGEGYPLVSHLVGTMISPLRMLALDSDVCPTPVTYTVAPLNTYTFLKAKGRGGSAFRASKYPTVGPPVGMPSGICIRPGEPEGTSDEHRHSVQAT